jgi:alpha-glucosidase
LLHSRPAYTVAETREGPYSLLVSQAADGYAFGTAYIDDGESLPPTPSRTVRFHGSHGSLSISSTGSFHVKQQLETITILGTMKPSNVVVGGKPAKFEYMEAQQKLVVSDLNVDLNSALSVSWS